MHNKKLANMILNDDSECLPPKIRNKVRMSTLTTPIQCHSRSPEQCNEAIKRNKRGTDYRGRNKIFQI